MSKWRTDPFFGRLICSTLYAYRNVDLYSRRSSTGNVVLRCLGDEECSAAGYFGVALVVVTCNFETELLVLLRSVTRMPQVSMSQVRDINDRPTPQQSNHRSHFLCQLSPSWLTTSFYIPGRSASYMLGNLSRSCSKTERSPDVVVLGLLRLTDLIRLLNLLFSLLVLLHRQTLMFEYNPLRFGSEQMSTYRYFV